MLKYDCCLPTHADALDLGLLLELSELYCLVCPSNRLNPVQSSMWAVAPAMSVSPPQVLATFVATSGRALISIVEHIVEDVLLVGGSAATPSSTSSSRQRGMTPVYGGGNPDVKLEHLRGWYMDMMPALKLVLQEVHLAGSPAGQPKGEVLANDRCPAPAAAVCSVYG